MNRTRQPSALHVMVLNAYSAGHKQLFSAISRPRGAFMGFCDDVKMELAYPEYGVEAGDMLQTKNLYAGGHRFTITAMGELVEHCYRYEQDPSRAIPGFTHPPLKAVHVGDRAISYHGDLLLWAAKSSEVDDQLVARFTHGTLEWVRPICDYPEENQALLLEQGAR